MFYCSGKFGNLVKMFFFNPSFLYGLDFGLILHQSEIFSKEYICTEGMEYIFAYVIKYYSKHVLVYSLVG